MVDAKPEEVTMDTEKTILVRVKKFTRLLDRLMEQTRSGVAKKIEGTKNISPIQGRIVLYVYSESKKRSVHQKDIETHFDIRRSTTTIILGRMEKNALITRETSDVDVRMKIVSLTQKAKDMYLDAKEEVEKAESQLIKGLSPPELDVFIKVLEKMTENIS